jgi:hypothetical protein
LAAGREPGTDLTIIEIAHVVAVTGVSACNAEAGLELIVCIAVGERIFCELGEDRSRSDKAQD